MKWPHLFHRWETYGRKGSHYLQQCRVCGKQRWDWLDLPLPERNPTYHPMKPNRTPERYDLQTGERIEA